MTTDLTVRILSDIRDAVRETNTRLDSTNTRLDEMRVELSGRIDELSHWVVESEIRTASVMTSVAGSVREVAALLREQNDLRPRVER